MTIPDLLNIFSSQAIFPLFTKLFGIVFGLIYLLFAIIMIKQIDILRRAIEVVDRGILSSLAYLQLALSIIILTYALFIL